MEWLESAWAVVKAFVLAPEALLALSSISLLCCVVSIGVATWAVRHLPADYLLHASENERAPSTSHVRLVLRNVLGGILLVLGVLMLILPGQGVLTIVAALAVMNFRRKRRWEQRLLARPHVLALINRLRQRGGHPPLLAPSAPQKAPTGTGTRRAPSRLSA